MSDMKALQKAARIELSKIEGVVGVGISGDNLLVLINDDAVAKNLPATFPHPVTSLPVQIEIEITHSLELCDKPS